MRLGLAALGWTLAGLLLLPHLTLLLVSFVPRGDLDGRADSPGYTLRNYVTLLDDPVRARRGQQPLARDRRDDRSGDGGPGGRHPDRPPPRAWRASSNRCWPCPWAVPGTVFAIAIATAFSVDAPWAGRFILVGTVWILPLAYLVRNLPITSRAILAGFRGLDPSLDEAAASLGAGRWRTLRRVTLPLLRPALLAGASLAFVTAFGDFVTSIMLYTYDTRPVSLEILSSLRQADVGVAAAYGVVLMLVSAAVFAVGADRGSAG